MSWEKSPLVSSVQTPNLKGRTMALRLALFVIVGATLGFEYHRFVGCRTGACPITANPHISTLYGAAMGFLLSGRLR